MPSRTQHICVFEDASVHQFFPLVYFRPVYNLRVGILSLKEKIIRRLPSYGVTIHCRSYLAEYMRLRNPNALVNEIPEGSCLFVNGRVVAGDALIATMARGKGDVLFRSGDVIVGARLSGGNLDRIRKRLPDLFSPSDFPDIPVEQVEAQVLAYPWDAVHANGREIESDTAFLRKGRRSPSAIAPFRSKGVAVLGQKNVYVGKGTIIGPGSVIDATGGPVVIGEDVRIFPKATLIGPLFIGNKSVVKVDAQLYPNTSIGPVCKVGGEIEGSIIHGYSNKQHHGFLGHSYIGAWVNLGAGTTNSDLKSNYGLVRVSMGSEMIETGHQFVGLMMGDHSKTAINSMFNTGTIVGVCSNIFGFGFPPKFVPSFSWGAAGETFTTFGIDRAIDMARRVMARRSLTLTETEERLIRNIFARTADLRLRTGMPA